MLRIGTVLIVALFAVTLRAKDLVVTSAQIEPEVALPAAPFWISFTVQNSKDSAVRIPQKYVVEVTPESGEPFIASQIFATVVVLPDEYATVSDIRGGEARQIDFPVGREIGDGLLFDKRLWRPGTYRIRLILSDELRSDRLQHMS